MLRTLLAYVLDPPPCIRPEEFRSYRLFSVGTLSGFLIHVFYSTLFAVYGVHEMLLANTVSLPTYALAFLLNRRGHPFVAMAMCTVELCAHQILALRYLGWEAGFQYFLLLVPVVVFYLPGSRNWAKLAMAALAVGTFFGLKAWSMQLAPVYTVDPAVLSAATYMAIVGTLGLLAFLAHFYNRAAETAEQKLREEYNRAEDLLHNILPVPIARRLKDGPGTIADGFSDASVLFADIVGFTGLSEKVSPQRLVALLNELFSEFDDLVVRRGLEKIKTIGDAYMVAAGIPEPRPDHAEAIVELAFDMLEAAARHGDRLGCPFNMRVGVNSGPVVAGVIGRRKFIYDLWGDSVNTAARMESHGIPGAVQVSQETLDRLGGRYLFEARGEISIKGKGTMPVYLVKARRKDGAPGQA